MGRFQICMHDHHFAGEPTVHLQASTTTTDSDLYSCRSLLRQVNLKGAFFTGLARRQMHQTQSGAQPTNQLAVKPSLPDLNGNSCISVGLDPYSAPSTFQS